MVDLSIIAHEEIYKHGTLGLLEMVQKHILQRDLLSFVKDIVNLVQTAQPGHKLFNSLLYYIFTAGETSNESRVIKKEKKEKNFD